MSEDQPGDKGKDFAEVHVPQARVRNNKGQWVGLGTPVESLDKDIVKRALRKKDFRRFLEDNEHLALKVIVESLRDKKVPAKERLQAAQDLLNRLHGKALGPNDQGGVRKKLEQMSTDELQDHIANLARDAGINIARGVN